jgi:hypothetical protein
MDYTVKIYEFTAGLPVEEKYNIAPSETILRRCR